MSALLGISVALSGTILFLCLLYGLSFLQCPSREQEVGPYIGWAIAALAAVLLTVSGYALDGWLDVRVCPVTPEAP